MGNKIFDQGLSQDEALLALEHVITKCHREIETWNQCNVILVNHIGKRIGFNLECNPLLALCFDKEAMPGILQTNLSKQSSKKDVIQATYLMEKLFALDFSNLKQEKLDILKHFLERLEAGTQ